MFRPKSNSKEQLHDDIISLQLPASLSLLFSCANKLLFIKPQWDREI